MVIKIENDKISNNTWWNRPLIGKKTLTEYLLKTNNRLKVPFETIYRHGQILDKLEQLFITLKALFNPKFASVDFLIYARIEQYLAQKINLGTKHYFSRGKIFFQVILDNLNFLVRLKKLEEEFKNGEEFKNEILQGFYRDCQNLINQENHKLIFQAKLRKSYQLYLQKLTEDEEIYALRKYCHFLFNLSKVEYLLEFLSLLKKHNLDNWQLFKNLKILVSDNQEDSIDELKPFVLLAKMYEESLIDIGNKIIKIKKSSSNQLTTIAQILQYVALSYKYENLYPQFRLFLSSLRKWEQKYDDILFLRQKYSEEEYLIPSSFKTKLNGFELYKNYHDYLGFSEKVQE